MLLESGPLLMEWGPVKKHLVGLMRWLSGISLASSTQILSENLWWKERKERSSFQSYPPPSILALENAHLHTHHTYSSPKNKYLSF